MNAMAVEIESKGMTHVKGILQVDDLLVLRDELVSLIEGFNQLPDDLITKSDGNASGEIREIANLSLIHI